MADVYKGLTITLGVDTTSLSAGIRKAKSEMAGVTNELRKIDRALKLDPGNVKLLAQQQADYRKAIGATEKELEALRAAEEQIGQEDMSSEQWVKLQSDIALAEQKLKGYKQALTESMAKQEAANTLLGKFGSKLTSAADQLEKTGKAMQTVGRGLTTGVTLPIAAAGAASVNAAVEIDDALTSVKKTVDGTAEQYEQLKDAAVEFSKANAVEADQILEIQALGAQLGFTISELDEFGEVVSGLDIATNMDAETAATEMAQFANITKMAHEDIDEYGSAIVGLGNSFATTESDISSMAMRLAASGTQVGMSQADILGLATALSSMGVEAEAGGTAISTIMAQIDKDIALNSASVETWASTAGMSAQQFADAWKSDPVEALSALLSNMEAATAEGGNMSVMLDELGIDSVRQTDIMKRLAGNSELVGNAVAKANQAWSENTALQAEVDNRNESLASKFQILKNRVTAIAQELGGPLADSMLDIVEDAEPLIEAISDGAKAFSEMDEGQQKAVLSAVALAAAVGPALNVTGRALTNANALGEACVKLAEKFAASRIGADDLAESTDSGTKSTDKATRATKASASAMKLAKLAAAGLAVAGLALIAAKAKEAYEKQQNLVKATEGLEDATRFASATMASGTASMGEYGAAAAGASSDVDGLIERQAQLAAVISQRNDSAAGEIATLGAYGDIIEELAGKSGLTADEQAKLHMAVDRVNESCGTSYEIVKNAAGEYVVMADGAEVASDAIDRLVKSQQAQIQMEALSSNYADVMAQKTAAAEAMAAAEMEYSIAVGQRRQLEEQGLPVSASVLQAEANAEVALRKTQEAYAATTEAERNLVDQMTVTQMMIDGTATTFDEFTYSSATLIEGINLAGQSTEAFRQSLADTGVSIEQLRMLNDSQLAQLGLAYDGTTASIVAKLQDFGIQCGEQGSAAGEQLTDATASAIEGGAGDVEAAAREVAQAQEAADVSEEGETWGSHLLGNIISGIRSKLPDLRSAAEEAAQAQSGPLHQTVADYGPLADTDKWGEHMLDNIIGGVRRRIPALRREMEGVAKMMASPVNDANATLAVHAAAESTLKDGLPHAASAVMNQTSSVSNVTNNTWQIQLDGATINSDDAIEGKFYDCLVELKRYAKMEGGE